MRLFGAVFVAMLATAILSPQASAQLPNFSGPLRQFEIVRQALSDELWSIAARRADAAAKEERLQAFRETIPYFDGKCGERIKDHIAKAILDETRDPVMDKLTALEDEVRELRSQLAEIKDRCD